MGHHNQELGRAGEDVAAHAYRRAGYHIVESNWRTARGEIDLIVSTTDQLVFVEVKTRSSDRFGSAAEAVGRRKQETIKRVASAYLREPAVPRYASIRFDVAAVSPSPHGMSVSIIRNAF